MVVDTIMLLSRGRALDRDMDRDSGNKRCCRDSYNLHKDTDTGNLRCSCRDTDTGTDKGSSNPLDTDLDMCKSVCNNTGYYKASDTGMDTGIRNPGRRRRRYIASLKPKEPEPTSWS